MFLCELHKTDDWIKVYSHVSFTFFLFVFEHIWIVCLCILLWLLTNVWILFESSNFEEKFSISWKKQKNYLFQELLKEKKLRNVDTNGT